MRNTHRAYKPDYILLTVTGLLVLAGLLIMASASPVLSSNKFGQAYYFLSRQTLGVGIGLVCFVVGYFAPYKLWRKLMLPLLILSAVLMVLAILPSTGLKLKGASRWIDLGPITVQPAEFMKISFIGYLAVWLANRKREVKKFKTGFLPFLVMMGFVSIFFILQKDIGTLGVLAISALLLFFISGARIHQVAILIAVGLLAVGVFAYLEPYRIDRLKVFLNPGSDKQGAGYQITQALIAIGSGGPFGRGFGLSRQKFRYLPEATSDSIFAVFGEEFGFVGSVALMTLFVVFFWRGFRTATRAPDPFARNLAAGITLLITTQAFINIAAISGLLPLTGIPLSFISYGSSALITNLAATGILLHISKYAR